MDISEIYIRRLLELFKKWEILEENKRYCVILTIGDNGYKDVEVQIYKGYCVIPTIGENSYKYLDIAVIERMLC